MSARVNPSAELARWLFEHYHITYHERVSLRAKGSVDGLAVVGSEGTWSGARWLLDGFDAKTRPGQRLCGESGPERSTNFALLERLVDLLLLPVARYVFAEMLPHKAVLFPVIADGAPPWERAFVYWLYPLWRRSLARRLDFSPALVAEAPEQIRKACDVMEAELARRGTRFVGGDTPGVVDIVFAALAAPVVLPPQYGATLPARELLPDAFKSFVDQMRARRAGQFVLDA